MDRLVLSGLPRASRVHFVLAWALCVLSLLLAAVTWLPGADQVPSAAVGAALVAVFPVFGVALLRALLSESGRALLGRANSGRMVRFTRRLPTGLKCSYAVILAALVLAVATGGGAARDANSDGHGGYYYTRWNNTELRSERVALSEREYHEATKAQARVFASWAALFHAIGSFLVLVSASPAVTRREESGARRET